MPNPNTIRYSTATQSGALRKGNFYLGVTDRDYGPTNITGYYNGVTFSSGYLTYFWDGGQIRYNQATDDSQLTTFLSTRAGVQFAGLTSALLWSVTQSDIIIADKTYDNIITDSLIFYLDASNVSSYPKIGDTCYDISGRSNNATLVNGVSFTSSNGGFFRLDGTNDRIDVPKTLSGFTYNIHYDIDWTIECWMYLQTPDGSPQTYKMIYGNYSGCNYALYPGNGTGFIIYNANNSSTIYTDFGFGPKSPSGCPDSVSWNTSESSWVYELAVNKWCHFAITSTDGTNYRVYVNGVQRGSTKTFDFKNSSSRAANNLAATSNYSWGGSFMSSEANQVDFSAMRIYNRPLSSDEITQNYRSSVPRYGTALTNVSPPTITGVNIVSRTLTAITGTWSGTSPIDFTYQWQRSIDGGSNFSNIIGSTASTYVVAAIDASFVIRCSVTANNYVSSAQTINTNTL